MARPPRFKLLLMPARTGECSRTQCSAAFENTTSKAMVEAVETLEYSVTLLQSAFAVVKKQLQVNETRKAG
jgi:hypothetical protein